MAPTDELEKSQGIISEIKETLATFFDPIKQSWDANGTSVIESAKNALSNIKTLCADIGKVLKQSGQMEQALRSAMIFSIY